MFPDTLTSIKLLTDVPFQSDYKHVRRFVDIAAQEAYFTARPVVKSFANANVVRTANAFTLLLTLTPAQANRVAYLTFKNAELDNKTYYCFVKSIEYENFTTCKLTVEIDFYQTFQFDVQYERSYIERQHDPLTNVEDNLALGQELITRSVGSHQVNEGRKYIVVVASERLTDNELAKSGTWTGAPTPLFHYVVPVKTASAANTGFDFNGNPLPSFEELFFLIQNQWANKIIAVYITPYCGLNFSLNGNNLSYETTTNRIKEEKIVSDQLVGDRYMILANDIKKFDEFSIILNMDYSTPYNAKLAQYPYRRFVLSTLNGQQLELKPQYLSNNRIEITVKGTIGLTSKVMYQVTNYASTSANPNNVSTTLIDETPNALPIIVDQYAAYVQGHTNSLNAAISASKNDWKTSGKVAERSADTAVTNGLIGSSVGVGASALGGDLNGVIGGATRGLTNAATSMLSGATSIQNANDIGKNNFENLVNNQNAMLNDLQSAPPNVKSMGGNPFFEFGNFDYDIMVTTKEVDTIDAERISKYYDVFGYKVSKYGIINQTSETNYNYVKTNDCIVTGKLNQSILDVFKRIFDNGVFIHHTNTINI